MELIKRQWHETIGGYENAIIDKHMDAMPSDEALIDEVYQEVIRTKALAVRGGYIPVDNDIRFLGTQKIIELITEFHTTHKD